MGALVLAATMGLLAYGHAVSHKVSDAADQVRAVPTTGGSSGIPNPSGDSGGH